ncbi:ribonucleoside-diphosphate reductase subunit alpha [Pseudenhygromyxa sp. WMMC2535]|uniref:ribonucleoside-diphosphate reductase subunit alpha n=1 Tax=Pseudenhygromyxa sp. WMMC2535 TaxID=2712867 RepID=UPI001555314B|nr:ribonucleoside-diphosphate reductase subunit alpha [Pseudenhygromyxa sp. WMMC2535]NVB38528.1 ribonucleoside-diphosphate reductase subunit alpha [Pseudenhygromyxa sp. WMMC2535]
MPTASTPSPTQPDPALTAASDSLSPAAPPVADAELRRLAAGLDHVDLEWTIDTAARRLPPGADARAHYDLLAHTAIARVDQAPEYASLAARCLARVIELEVGGAGITGFVNGIEAMHRVGLINERLLEYARHHGAALQAAIDPGRDAGFDYFGLRTVYDRYLLRHPRTRAVLETPQHFFMRVAAALSEQVEDALELYTRYSRLDLLPSSPTLFNAGTRREQLSSCYLLDSPRDHLLDIYARYTDVAQLSKFAGGVGLSYSRIRSRGSLIGDTNGHSNGIVPWLKTLDASVAAVNQGGRRKGACCVYLETWHADIEEFLELRDNTGNEYARTHNLNIANWIPDLFMRRVEADAMWSLFDPKAVRHLVDLYGEKFERAYEAAERAGLATKQLPARALYGRMMRTLAQTGNGWMCFKDRSNATCNQTARPGRTVHLSNLCTEILEVTNDDETAVCNLASVNLAHHLTTGEGEGEGEGEGGLEVDWDKLRQTVEAATRALNRVIDINYYPIASAETANQRWRPIGLGVMGFADMLLMLGLDFDSRAAQDVARRVAEHIYFHALRTSCELARDHGPHPAYPETRVADGALHPDLWEVSLSRELDWSGLRTEIAAHGLRNSLLVAIAPTATIASIAGCYECIEPIISNIIKRETLSGEFVQINRHLVRELRALGLWDAEMIDALKANEGSIQAISRIPAALRRRFRTAWELPMRALLDLAVTRAPFVDQSQSLNLFMETPDIARLSSMYFYAWTAGLKTTYYLRSRPATRIAKTTLQAKACDLENPQLCEACQ